MHDIVDMRPVVKMGYEIVVTNSSNLDIEEYFKSQGKQNPYKGLPGLSISFNCTDSNGNLYEGKYDTSTRILLVNINGKWKVFGFK